MKDSSKNPKVSLGKKGRAEALFNFEGPKRNFSKKGRNGERAVENLVETWGCSSAGRAPALQAGGRQFDSVHLH